LRRADWLASLRDAFARCTDSGGVAALNHRLSAGIPPGCFVRGAALKLSASFTPAPPPAVVRPRLRGPGGLGRCPPAGGGVAQVARAAQPRPTANLGTVRRPAAGLSPDPCKNRPLRHVMNPQPRGTVCPNRARTDLWGASLDLRAKRPYPGTRKRSVLAPEWMGPMHRWAKKIAASAMPGRQARTCHREDRQIMEGSRTSLEEECPAPHRDCRHSGPERGLVLDSLIRGKRGPKGEQWGSCHDLISGHGALIYRRL